MILSFILRTEKMLTFSRTAQTITEKLKLSADVLVFRPVTDCRDKLLTEITACIGGRILCVLPCTANAWYTSSFAGTKCYFIGKSLPPKTNADVLKTVKESESCVLFTSASMLTDEDFASFVQDTAFSAMYVLQAENVSPVQCSFDKRLLAVAELRTQPEYKLPVCAFCATDSSPVIRDIINNLQLKTPSRIYPGVALSQENLFSQQTTSPFTAFEALVQDGKISRAVVLCTSRQTAEDAYRYFRFFGHRCALSHGAIEYTKRQKAVDRFASGEIDFLFTTRFTQGGFCKANYSTVLLGLPTDVWQLQRLRCPNEGIFCFYTPHDKAEAACRIEEENEIRAQYTRLLPFNLKTERQLQFEYALQLLSDGKAPCSALQKDFAHIYFEEK